MKSKMIREEKASIFAQHDGHCAYCGRGIKRTTFFVDEGRPACRPCRLSKHGKSTEEFRDQMLRQVETLRRYHTGFRQAEAYGLIHAAANPTVIFHFERPAP